MSRYYTGPVSDHFNGECFFDPQGVPPRSRRELNRWLVDCYWRRSKAKWPAWAPSPYADRPPPRVDGATCRISYVGHASFLLQIAGLNILLDPVWSMRASPFRRVGPKRVNDPGIAFADLPPIDVVLVSHAHYDHLDVATLSRLTAAHRPRVIAPLGNDAIMRSHDKAIAAEGYDWHDRVEVGPDAAVTLVPTRHWSARSLSDRNMSLWASFVIEAPAGRIYFVGDSSYGEGEHFRDARKRYGPFKLALLPIGAYEPRWFMADQHMNRRSRYKHTSIAAPNVRSATTTARSSSPTRQSMRRLLRWPKRCGKRKFRRSVLGRCAPGRFWSSSGGRTQPT